MRSIPRQLGASYKKGCPLRVLSVRRDVPLVGFTAHVRTLFISNPGYKFSLSFALCNVRMIVSQSLLFVALLQVG